MGKRSIFRLASCLLVFIAAALLFRTPANTSTGTNPDGHQAENSQQERTETQDDSNLKLELIGYQNAISSFTQIDSREARDLDDSGAHFILYTGRPTCQWCRKLAPSLQEASRNLGLEIFYLDSTDSESNADLKQFRTDHGITEVPSVIELGPNGNEREILIPLNSQNMDEAVTAALRAQIDSPSP